MKPYCKIIPLVLSATLALSACGDKANAPANVSKEVSDAVRDVQNLNQLSASASKMEQLQEKLQGLEPLSNSALKGFFPETLDGYKRNSISVGNNEITIGIATGRASYSDGAGKEVTIQITDGAGEVGAPLIALTTLGYQMESENEDDYRIEKTTEFNGRRGITSEEKSDSTDRSGRFESGFKFIEKERYGIEIRGQRLSLAEIKKVMDQLNYTALQ